LKGEVLVWVSLILSALAQVCLRKGTRSLTGRFDLAALSFWLEMASSIWIWCWGASFAVATALWLVALSRVDVSYAVPLLSAGYILVAILSKFLLREQVSFGRWSAVAVIAAGVVLIAKN